MRDVCLKFRFSELVIATLLVASVCLCLSFTRSQTIAMNATDYAIVIGGGSLLIAVGLAYRLTERSASIAATTIGCGLFIWLTLSLSTLNYLFLPRPVGAVDVFLAELDAHLGFYWPNAMEFASHYPGVSTILSMIYQSTLFQIVILFVSLGLTSRLAQLDRALLAISIASLGTVLFWAAFPSLGPTTMYVLPPHVLAQVNPVVDLNYGRALLELAANGSAILDPRETKGLIAFPSFHTVLLLIVLFYLRTIRWIFWPLLAFNLAMPAAIIIHGGHHLTDLFGGAAMFAVAAFVTDRLMALERLRSQVSPSSTVKQRLPA